MYAIDLNDVPSVDGVLCNDEPTMSYETQAVEHTVTTIREDAYSNHPGSPQRQNEFIINRMQEELIRTTAKYERLLDKVMHGCTDAYCAECEGDGPIMKVVKANLKV